MLWTPGSVIEQRDLDWRGDVTTVRPQVVVNDDGERLILFGPAGAAFASRTMRDRTSATLDARLAYFSAAKDVYPMERRNSRWNVLTINPSRQNHSIWVFWRPDWEFLGWYVNLQRVMERRSYGIEVADWFLDLFVAPDGEWQWKDEDEFEGACRLGLLDDAERQMALAEAARVAVMVQRGGPPFDEGWPLWRPDPSWPDLAGTRAEP